MLNNADEAICISHLFEFVVPVQVIVLPTSISDVAAPPKVIAVVVLLPLNKTLASEFTVIELTDFAPSTITVIEVLKTTSSVLIGVKPPDQFAGVDQVPPEAPTQVRVAALEIFVKNNTPDKSNK